MLILLLICHIISFLVLLSYVYRQFDSKLNAILLANLFGLLIGIIPFAIIITFFAYDTTSTITRPIKPTVRLVTTTQVLKPGDHIKSVDSEGYLTTGDATKKVSVKVKGDGDTIKNITYAEQHTDKKVFGLTLQKDNEKPKAMAIINTKESTKTLKHFFD